jgi:hypothetical protein
MDSDVETLQTWLLKSEAQVRIPLAGGPNKPGTDDRWRRIYNEKAESEDVPIDAMGHGAHTVLIVRVPNDTPPDQMRSILWKAEALIQEADKAYASPAWDPTNIVGAWWVQHRGGNPLSGPGEGGD